MSDRQRKQIPVPRNNAGFFWYLRINIGMVAVVVLCGLF